jgi:hypothetical protein
VAQDRGNEQVAVMEPTMYMISVNKTDHTPCRAPDCPYTTHLPQEATHFKNMHNSDTIAIRKEGPLPTPECGWDMALPKHARSFPEGRTRTDPAIHQMATTECQELPKPKKQRSEGDQESNRTRLQLGEGNLVETGKPDPRHKFSLTSPYILLTTTLLQICHFCQNW